MLALTPTTTTLVSKDTEFSCASFEACEKFAASCPLPKRLRKNFKMDFRFSLPRKSVRVWYHFKWFLNLYNLLFSFKFHSSKILKNPGIQPIYNQTVFLKPFLSGYMRANTIFKDLITSILENGMIIIMTSVSWPMNDS